MITLIVLPLLISVLFLPVWVSWMQKMRITAVNYKGTEIVKTSGPILFTAAAAAQPFLIYLEKEKLIWASIFLFFTSMTLLGLLDDLRGDETVKGFKGHFSKAIQGKGVTTGFIKATAGWGVAIFISILIPGGSWYEWIIKGTYLALFTNFFNLMDTRPVRTVKLFIILSFIFVIISRERVWFFIPLWSAVSGYLYWETSEKIMLGDTGAYLLGSTLGVYSMLILPIEALAAAVLLLVLIHWLAEKISISSLLEEALPQGIMFRINKWGRN